MYDTINLWLGVEEVVGGDPLACLQYLNSIVEVARDDRVFYSGKLRNYRVNVSNAGISLKGSLAKYYLDDNILIPVVAGLIMTLLLAI